MKSVGLALLSLVSVSWAQTFPLRSVKGTGVSRFLGQSKQLKTSESSIKATSDGDSDKDGTESVETFSSDVAYVMDVSLGSDEQNFTLIVDTGSYYTWVYGSKCTESVCQKHQQFNPTNSTSFHNTSATFDISFTSGSIGGAVVNDRAQFAGFDTRIDFGLADEAASTFEGFPIDGIMGLSAKDVNSDEFPGVISILHDQKLIDKKIVSINLGLSRDPKDEGSVTFGGLDDSKYTGSVTYTNVTTQSGSEMLWTIPMDGLYVGGSKVDFGGDRNAIIDTGTTLIVMPVDDAKALHSQIPGSKSSDGSRYTVPCSSNFTIDLEFSGKKWSIPSEDVVASSSDDSDTCTTNIQGLTYQNQNDAWIVGDVFLKNVYSVFDMDAMRVGFASKVSSSTDETNPDSFVQSGGLFYSLNTMSGSPNNSVKTTFEVKTVPASASIAPSASSSSAPSSSPSSSSSSSSPSSSSSQSPSSSSSSASTAVPGLILMFAMSLIVNVYLHV